MVGCFRFPLVWSNAEQAPRFHRLLTELQRADIRRARRDLPAAPTLAVVSQPRRATGRVSVLMGSLIKKRRKRMRKKKHKKLLKKTRWQRRQQGK